MFCSDNLDDDITKSPSPYSCSKPVETLNAPTTNNNQLFILEGHLNSPVGKWSVEKLSTVDSLPEKEVKHHKSVVKRSLFSEKNETEEKFTGNT